MSLRIEAAQLGHLLEVIRNAGYDLLGPTVRDGAIAIDRISQLSDLPQGITDEQEKGLYRLRTQASPSYFGFSAPAQTFRRFLQPPTQTIFWASRDTPGGPLRMRSGSNVDSKLAFIGVKACDLAAIGVHDVVFGCDPNPQRPAADPLIKDQLYGMRRENLLIIATECGQAGSTCFCASMNTGPEIEAGYDLRITEFVDGEHWMLIDAGSEQGDTLLSHLAGRPASEDDLTTREQLLERTRRSMGRSLDTRNLPQQLARSFDSPAWEDIAERCLSCANCTLSCPTCFCTDIEDATDITGRTAIRTQRWDSCFNKEISWLHGGQVRKSTASRYRQWLTHKLSTWHDQFGSSGCVGCGRCITWCPVGIDITEEAARLTAGTEASS